MTLELINIKLACFIPTFNGVKVLPRLLDSLNNQTIKFDVHVIDSCSKDGTLELLASSNINSLTSISNIEFDHGGTRQLMIDSHPEYDILIFLTQDAYLENSKAIENLISLFSDESIGAVYGRQLPHLGATPLEAHARLFNYPDGKNFVRSYMDRGLYGLKTVFLSNSFSAYRKVAFEKVGGFPSRNILSEDMFVAAKMALQNWKIGYAADAECRHSHNYSLLQEFKRYFDIGVFHNRNNWIIRNFGSASGEGLRFVISELKYLGIKKMHLIPISILRNFLKYIGYKLGLHEQYLHYKIKKLISFNNLFIKTTNEIINVEKMNKKKCSYQRL